MVCSRSRALGGHLGDQVAIVVRLEELERQVLELGLDAGHAESMRQRGVDLASLEGDAAPPLRRQVLERAHVVEPVGELDDDDSRVFRDREEQFPVVLDLLLRARPEGEARDLGESVYDAGDLAAELLGDVLRAHIGIFDDIVQERRRDGGAVEQLFRENEGDRDGVRHEVFARHSLLSPMRGRAEAKRPLDQIEIEAVGVPLEDGAQIRGQVGQRAGHSNPALAKLT